MKIYYAKKLLNEHAQPPTSFVYRGKNSVEKNAAIESERALVRCFGNYAASIAFKVERAHDTPEAAAEFALRHVLEVNKQQSGELLFTTDAGKTILEMQNAAIASVAASADGCSTTVSYEFQEAQR